MRLGTPRAVNSTLGKANPSQVDGRPPYRYRGIPGWEPGAPHLREASPPKDGGLAPGHRNSPASRAARFAAFCVARKDGKGVRDAGVAAGVAIKTARRYEQDRRKALLVAAELAAASSRQQQGEVA